MPIFDYKCERMGHVLKDELVSIPDEMVFCDECYAYDTTVELMTKIIGNVHTTPIFIGKGFHATDYKDKK